MPLLIIETVVLRSLKARGIEVPFVIRWLWTFITLEIAAGMFFFPPLEVHSNYTTRLVQRVAANVQLLQEALGL